MRTVWTTLPAERAKAARPGGIRLTDFLAAPGRRAEQREMRYRHILGAGASKQTIDAWLHRHPAQPLPSDLQGLVMRINGIHLWANVETGRSYEGLAPIEEWELVRLKMYGSTADPGLIGDRYVALSYHEDHASYVVLDVDSGRYFLMDSAGPDTTSPIASNVGELLDWIWRTRIPPKV